MTWTSPCILDMIPKYPLFSTMSFFSQKPQSAEYRLPWGNTISSFQLGRYTNLQKAKWRIFEPGEERADVQQWFNHCLQGGDLRREEFPPLRNIYMSRRPKVEPTSRRRKGISLLSQITQSPKERGVLPVHVSILKWVNASVRHTFSIFLTLARQNIVKSKVIV